MNVKRNVLRKILSMLVIGLAYTNMYAVECATYDTNTSATQTLQELINSLDEEQLEEFNARYNSVPLIERIALAILLNITVVSLVWYGPTICQEIVETMRHIPETIHDIGHILTKDIPQYLFATARKVALNRIRNADPETIKRNDRCSASNNSIPHIKRRNATHSIMIVKKKVTANKKPKTKSTTQQVKKNITKITTVKKNPNELLRK